MTVLRLNKESKDKKRASVGLAWRWRIPLPVRQRYKLVPLVRDACWRTLMHVRQRYFFTAGEQCFLFASGKLALLTLCYRWRM